MNIFSITVLITLLVKFALSLLADVFNLTGLKPEPPPELDGVYEPERYRKSQEYIRVTTKFGIIHGTFNLLFLLAFWFLKK